MRQGHQPRLRRFSPRNLLGHVPPRKEGAGCSIPSHELGVANLTRPKTKTFQHPNPSLPQQKNCVKHENPEMLLNCPEVPEDVEFETINRKP